MILNVLSEIMKAFFGHRVLHIFFLGLLTSCGSFQSNIGGFSAGGGSLKERQSHALNYPFKGSPQFRWPVFKPHITRGFLPKKRGRKHYGLDISGPLNKKIMASHKGLVIYAGTGYSGYGKVVIIEYNSSWGTLYAHLNKFNVKEGQFVNAGDVIGGMGKTGRSTGVHLHFEIIKNKLPVNPLNYLKH